MVEEKIKKLQGTKTIIHIDNVDHWKIIKPYTTLSSEFIGTNFAFSMNKEYNYWSDIFYYRENKEYQDFKIITSSELLGCNIYELW